MAEWFVCWTMKLATWVRIRVAAGLPTGYSVLGGILTGLRYQIDYPDSLISSAELSDDCVSKFASLVRARD